jgi:hypothetical protein
MARRHPAGGRTLASSAARRTYAAVQNKARRATRRLTSPYASPLQIRQGVEEVVEVRIRGLMGGAATTAVCDRRIGVHRVRGEVPCGLTWLPYASTASEAGLNRLRLRHAG